MPDRSFSFSSVILSYLMVAGGMVLGLAGVSLLHLGENALYVSIGGGAFIGGFFAARASHGSTIIEPAIGALAVIATMIGLVMSSKLGTLLWHEAQSGTTKVSAIMGAVALAGSIGGAFTSEKLLGEATTSGAPWVLYTALATLGACLLGFIFGFGLALDKSLEGKGVTDAIATAVLIGIAAGSLLAGIAAGASARVRILLPALIGSAAGTMAFVLLISKSFGGGTEGNSDALVGWLIIAAGGAILTLIGSAIGWATVGKKQSAF